jgi:hypothetical protein
MEPSSHHSPEVRERSNELLRQAGYFVFEPRSVMSSAGFRSTLDSLRARAFFAWPAATFGLMMVAWFFEKRVPLISGFAFVGCMWVMFFRAYRAQIQLSAFRCPSCGERFFLRKNSWLMGPSNIWSNRCKNCGCHAI